MANKKPVQNKKSAPKKAQAKKNVNAEVQAEPLVGGRGAEVLGLFLIALGVLLGIYLYGGGPGFLATWIGIILYASAGVTAYALPVIFVLLGVASILSRKKKPVAGGKPVIAITIILAIAFVHAAYRVPYRDAEGAMVPLWDYFQDTFARGVHPPRTGGGIVGGLLCYILQFIGGSALCWVLLSVGLAVCLLLVTRISLRTFAEVFSANVRHALDRMDIREDIEVEVPVKGRKLYVDEIDAADTRRPKRRPQRKGKIPFDQRFTVPDIEPAEEQPDTLEFMPLSGRLQKRATVQSSVVSSPLSEENDPIPEVEEKPKPDLFSENRKLKTENCEAESAYVYPLLDYLNHASDTKRKGGGSPEATARLLENTLASFNISAKVVDFSVGPVVTRFELQPAPGVRVNRITTLSNDIALALAASRVRIEAPIPGKAAIGIEIPNKDTVNVVLRDIIASPEFQKAASPVTLALGKDIAGKIIVADLSKMPHMLIAGSTGSGKSVCLNDLIISLTYKSTPAELRLILIDPKMVELSTFADLPHLLIPVVTDPKKAAGALRWACNEMTARYKKFSEVGARDVGRYNQMQSDPADRLPKVVVIIDELADLMMVAPDEVEDCICRVAQLGRAAGIHLIVATQRPSADIITGLIKANIPSRCSFAVSSSIDSRIILDRTGAEKLLGRGDMLFHPNGAGEPIRLQCAFVSDQEVERVTKHFKKQEAPQFDEQIIADVNTAAKGGPAGGVFGEGKQEDELLGEAVRVVLDMGQASISMIQRRLRVGYARAARLIDIMEQKRYVSEGEGSKPRKVLISRAEYHRVFGEEGALFPEEM